MSEQRDITKLWMVPYADLMSLLMILFLGLFGFAYLAKRAEYEKAIADLQKQFQTTTMGRAASDQQEKEAAVAERLENQAQESHTALEITAKRIRLTWSSPILFEEGSAELKPEASPSLEKIAQALRDIPNPVWVAGFTDDHRVLGGRFKTNWELSAARAYSVVDFFVRQGLPPSRFSILGYGEYHPIAPNTTEEGRKMNRRIEISILRQA